MTRKTRKLTFRSPKRAWILSPQGWRSRAWTLDDVQEAKMGGAWFEAGYHDFDSVDTATSAIQH